MSKAGADLPGDVDLAPELQRYVLDTHARLSELTHYALLEVAPDAQKVAVKRAYFRLAGLVHPDRFYGKRLGPFKPMIDALFARITEAHATLSSTEGRAAYDASLGRSPSQPAAASGQAPKAPVVDPKVAAERRAAMEALKERFQQGKAKGQRQAEIAARARAAGDFVAAAEAYRVALSFDPNDATLRAAYDETRARADETVRDSHRKKALLEEKYGHWPEAAAAWRQLLTMRPDDAEARERLANAIAKSR